MLPTSLDDQNSPDRDDEVAQQVYRVAVGIGEVMAVRHDNKAPKVVALIFKLAECSHPLAANQEL